MKRWKTQKVIDLLKVVPNIKLLDIGDQGSEICTKQLAYEIDGCSNNLYIRGFNTDHQNNILDPDDADVEMVEVTSEYSDGGESSEPGNILARALITIELVKAGFSVVRSLDLYF